MVAGGSTSKSGGSTGKAICYPIYMLSYVLQSYTRAPSLPNVIMSSCPRRVRKLNTLDHLIFLPIWFTHYRVFKVIWYGILTPSPKFLLKRRPVLCTKFWQSCQNLRLFRRNEYDFLTPVVICMKILHPTPILWLLNSNLVMCMQIWHPNAVCVNSWRPI